MSVDYKREIAAMLPFTNGLYNSDIHRYVNENYQEVRSIIGVSRNEIVKKGDVVYRFFNEIKDFLIPFGQNGFITDELICECPSLLFGIKEGSISIPAIFSLVARRESIKRLLPKKKLPPLTSFSYNRLAYDIQQKKVSRPIPYRSPWLSEMPQKGLHVHFGSYAYANSSEKVYEHIDLRESLIPLDTVFGDLHLLEYITQLPSESWELEVEEFEGSESIIFDDLSGVADVIDDDFEYNQEGEDITEGDISDILTKGGKP